MDIGPINYEERAHLKDVIKRNIGAIARSADDIGSFTGFGYEMKYKRGGATR